MTDTLSSFITREARYYTKKARDINVTLTAPSGTLKGELVDISTGGARLKVRQAIATNEFVEMELKAKRPKRAISITGEICWVIPATGQDWCLGCSFNPKIPEEALQEFAEAGLLERRQHERAAIAAQVTAKWELSAEPEKVQILNYSHGGFCLLSQRRGKPGDRVLLQLRSEDGQKALISAKAQWQVETETGFVVGCEFLHPRDYTFFVM